MGERERERARERERERERETKTYHHQVSFIRSPGPDHSKNVQTQDGWYQHQHSHILCKATEIAENCVKVNWIWSNQKITSKRSEMCTEAHDLIFTGTKSNLSKIYNNYFKLGVYSFYKLWLQLKKKLRVQYVILRSNRDQFCDN